MDLYRSLAESVKMRYINRKPVLVDHSKKLRLAGVGRSAFVFKIENTDKALKVFFPDFCHIAGEEAGIYRVIQHVGHYPALYEAGPNYIVIDFIEGDTLFECLTLGIPILEKDIKAIDRALSSVRKYGLNPSDIHLKNIMKERDGTIKIVDVARFRQTKQCRQWNDLKNAFYRFYIKPFFPKKIPGFVLRLIARLYKSLSRRLPKRMYQFL